MPKYLSGRVKKTPVNKLELDRYKYLDLGQSEPDPGYPGLHIGIPDSGNGPVIPGGPTMPTGTQYQLVTVYNDNTATRYWQPVSSGLIPGSVSVYEEGGLVGSSNSITQLNFVGIGLTIDGVPLGIAATITVTPPGDNGSVLFKERIWDPNGNSGFGTHRDDFNTSYKLQFDSTAGILTTTSLNIGTAIAGVGGSIFNAVAVGDTAMVGVGTTTPLYNLHVIGDIGISSGTIYDVNNFGGNNGDIIIKNDDGYIEWKPRTSVITSAGGTVGNIQFHNTAGNIEGTSDYNSGTDSQNASNTFVWDSTNHRVGIGSTQPSSKFDVTGNSKFVGFTTTTDLEAQQLKVSGLSTFVGVATFKDIIYLDDIKISSNKIESTSGNLLVDSNAGTTQIDDVLYVNDTTESTNVDSGALQVNGGAGINKNLNVGGATSLAGYTTSENTFEYKFTTSSTPAEKQVYFDQGNYTTINTLKIHKTDDEEEDRSTLLASLREGDNIKIINEDDTTKTITYKITGDSTVDGDVYTLPILYSSGTWTTESNLHEIDVTITQKGEGSVYLASSGGITTTGGDLYIGGNIFINDDIFLDVARVQNLIVNSGVATFHGEVHALSNVGIGTTTPRAKFDVRPGGHSGDGAIIFTHDIGEVGSDNNCIEAINSVGSALQPLGYRATEHIFATQAKERLRITSDGKVGIGTTAPNSLLYIKSDDNVAGQESAGITTVLTLETTRTDMSLGKEYGPAIRFYNHDVNNNSESFIQANCPHEYIVGGVGYEAKREKTLDFNFKQKDDGTLKTTMTIKGQGGHVGIGSTTPKYALDLGVGTASTIRLVSQNDGTALRVGAGGGGNNVTLIRVDGSNLNHDGESDDSNYGFSLKYMGARTGNNNSFSLFSDNITGTQFEAITVLQDGKIGIGITNPNSIVSVGIGSTAAWPFDSSISGTYSDNPYSQELRLANTTSSGINDIFTGIFLEPGRSNVPSDIDLDDDNKGTNISPMGGDSVSTIGGSGTGLRVTYTIAGSGTGRYVNSVSIKSGSEGSGYQIGDWIEINTTTANESAYFYITAIDDAVSSARIGAVKSGLKKTDIVFGTRDDSFSEKVRIKSDGKVGIGTTNPTYKLEVSGITRITNDADNTATDMGNSGALTLHNLQDAKGTFIDFVADSANGTAGMMAKIGGWNTHAGSGYSGELTFSTRNGSNMVERLRITSEGYLKKIQDPTNRTVLPVGTGETYSGEGLYFDHYQYQSGSTYQRYADIVSVGDGTEGSNIRFLTMPGDGTAVERLRITSDGQVQIGGDSEVTGNLGSNTTWNLEVYDDAGDAYALLAGTTGAALELRDTVTSESVVLAANGGCNLYSYKAGDYIAFHNKPSGGSITERLRITSAGDVGIGTTNPTGDNCVEGVNTVLAVGVVTANTLYGTVIGGITVPTGDITIPEFIKHKDNTDTKFGFPTDDVFAVNTDGSEKLRIDSYGCVRVGNTGIKSTSSNTKRISLGAKGSIWGWNSENIDGALTLADNYYVDGAGVNKSIEADHAAYLTLRKGTLRFGTTDSTPSADATVALTEKLRITDDGKLLVGHNATVDTSTYNSNIQVMGTDADGSSITVGRFSDDASAPSLNFSKSRGESVGIASTVKNNDVIGNIFWWGSDSATSDGGDYEEVAHIGVQAGADFTSGSTPGDLTFWTTPVDATEATEKFRITSDGKISQGGHIPTYEYDLRGTGLQSILIGSENAGGAMLILDGDSNGDGAGTDYASILHSTDGNIEINNRKSADILFKTTSSETERLRITSDGDVGIGTIGKSIAGMSRYLTVSARNITEGGSALELVGNRGSADKTLGVVNFVNDKSNVGQIQSKYQGYTLSALTASGTGYNNGSHTNVNTTTSGDGTGLTVDITVVGGVVQNPVTIYSTGSGYEVDDELTINGQGGSNATLKIASVDGSLHFNTSGSERLRIFSNGRIGIGTDTAPRSMVHLHNSTANDSSYIQFTNANTGGTGLDDGTLIGISQNNSNTDGTGSGFTILNKENAEITLGTNNLERLRITSAGKLIITPNITETTAYDYAGVYITSVNAVSGTPDGFFINNTAANTGDNASLSFSTDSGHRKKSAISHVDTGDYGKGDLVFSVSNQHLDTDDFNIIDDEKLRITSEGCVGIGTTTPRFNQLNAASGIKVNDTKLGVLGSITIAGLTTIATDVRELSFYRRGGTGAGDTAITDHHMGRIAWYGSSNDPALPDKAWSIEVNPDGGDWTDADNRKGYLSFVGHNTEALRITSTGDVGIGTTNPTGDNCVEGVNTVLAVGVVTTNTLYGSVVGGITATNDLTIPQWIKHKDHTDTKFGFPDDDSTGDTFAVETGGTERLRIDSNGRVAIGHTESIQFDSSTNFNLQVTGTSYATSGASQQRFEDDEGGASLILAHSRGPVGVASTLQDGDEFGKIRFHGSDGEDFNNYGAAIKAKVDGLVGLNSMPGRLEFHTTPSGSDASIERLRITSEGYLKYTGVRGGDETNKLGRLLMPSHDTNEEDVLYLQMQQEATFNQLEFGGGSADYNAATRIVFRTADVDTVTGTERLRITSSGQLLLGVTDAVDTDTTFQIHSATSGTGPILNMTNDTGDCRIFFGKDDDTGSANAQGQIRYNVENDYLAASTKGKERLGITSVGLVGIGTTIPTDAISSDNGNIGITTLAVAGIVTAYKYYGDGSNLTGLTGSQVPNLDASKITSGTFNSDRIPDLDATKITSGTIDAARIPDLDASKITSGTIDSARIPDLDGSKITGTVGYATSAGISTYADSAGIATYATNIKGGAIGSLPYQTAEDVTEFLGVDAGKFLKSTASGPTWDSIPPSGISDVIVKQYSQGTTERTCSHPIAVTSNNTIGIGSTSNAYGNKFIQSSDPSATQTVCDGDIWYDLSDGSGAVPASTSPPGSTSSPGTAGDIRYSASHLYICVATNSWKRVAVDGW